ncbi:MAG: leucine-rich repeat domain-containing protein, partial [Acutalibacteraceae bacterium]
MKTKAGKAVSILLALILAISVFTVVPTTTSAVQTDIKSTTLSGRSGDYEYDLSYDGTASIIRYTGSASTLTIPSTIDGVTVTGIGYEAFSDCTSLTSIIIPDSVTSIGYEAFYGCTSLKSVTIGNSVTRIDEKAFYGCTSLESVTIPDSVTTISDSAFSACTSLESITIPDSVTSIGYSAFKDTAWLANQPDGVVYAGKVAYTYKGEMPQNLSISLKNGTIGIAGLAFY